MRKLFLIISLLVFFSVGIIISRADEISDLQKQIDDIQNVYNDINRANTTNEAQLNKFNQQIEDMKSRMISIQSEITKKDKEVSEGGKALDYQKQLLYERAKNYYKNSGKAPFSLINLLVAENFSQSIQNFFYQRTLLDQDRQAIIKIVTYIKDLQQKKDDLKNQQTRLNSLKTDVDKQSQFLAGEVAKAKKYLGELQSKIAQLSAQQQSIIAQRQAGLNLPRSAGVSLGGCTDDRNIDPGFSSAFAFFTYGSTHRVGMNQYGAYGRSKAGQNYETILNAYYNNVRLECRNFPNNNIKVQGYSEINIYDYLKGIGEMPESWGNSGGYEALKAQVVAAASFAYAYTGSGSNEICTTQDCQVYIGSNKGGKWEEAVNDIKGKCGDGVQVMVSNDTGEVIKAWYASTHGGYEWTSGEIWGSQKPWTKHMQDTSSGANNFSELNDRAWDRESPWFYCDWGFRPENNKTAWLKREEVADIVNSLLLVKSDSSTGIHLGQPDKPTGDTWNQDRVKEELKKYRTPFNTINNISVSVDFGTGKVNNVSGNGDAGDFNFDGKEFKDFFNLRAPANIQIVGPLYNVEKR